METMTSTSKSYMQTKSNCEVKNCFCNNQIPALRMCQSNPCGFNGLCSEIPEGFSCDCKEGYTGNNCETGEFK